jgi:hypothetical protein
MSGLPRDRDGISGEAHPSPRGEGVGAMSNTRLSGDVWQDYNPFTSWWADTFRNAMGQYGFINVNEMQSSDAELEKGIVTDQASYGKQIGRVVEALQAICENLDTKGWKPDQRKALKSFLHMAEDLAQYKGDHQPVTKGDITALVDAIRSTK